MSQASSSQEISPWRWRWEDRCGRGMYQIVNICQARRKHPRDRMRTASEKQNEKTDFRFTGKRKKLFFL
jgi:hypothetical protein